MLILVCNRMGLELIVCQAWENNEQNNLLVGKKMSDIKDSIIEGGWKMQSVSHMDYVVIRYTM